jgi:hypothetical protein
MSQEDKRIQEQRKAARKTAVILAVVALGFFAWAVYKVASNAT